VYRRLSIRAFLLAFLRIIIVTDAEFRKAIQEIKAAAKGPLGINLITNKSNLYYESQLKTCIELKVDYIITSLGSPEKVIQACKPVGIKVI